MINQKITAMLLLIASTQITSAFGEITSTDRAQWNLAVKLLQKTAKDEESVVLSPLVVSSTLFILYLATQGTTKQELRDVLRGNASEIELQLNFEEIMDDIISAESNDYVLDFKNHFYIAEGVGIKESMKGMIKYYFNSTLNIFSLPEEVNVIKEANNWMSLKNDNKMANALTMTDINRTFFGFRLYICLFLVNTIYFKGTWERQFMREDTHKKNFYISGEETIRIPLMHKTEEVPYYEDNLMKLIRMPYTGGIEMVLILPRIRFALSEILKNLTGEKLLEYIGNAQKKQVSISLPKFRIERKLYLKTTLKLAGITYMFDEYIDLLHELLPISIDEFVHFGFIEVSEKGTESVEALQVTPAMLEQPRPTYNFIANQPFLFAIVKDSKIVLFAGQYAKPFSG